MSLLGPSRRHHPGERLIETIWMMALSSRGALPPPTVERVNAIRSLVSSWAVEDAHDAEPSNPKLE